MSSILPLGSSCALWAFAPFFIWQMPMQPPVSLSPILWGFPLTRKSNLVVPSTGSHFTLYSYTPVLLLPPWIKSPLVNCELLEGWHYVVLFSSIPQSLAHYRCSVTALRIKEWDGWMDGWMDDGYKDGIQAFRLQGGVRKANSEATKTTSNMWTWWVFLWGNPPPVLIILHLYDRT